MTLETALPWITGAIFVAACMWAKPKTELRMWALLLAGMLMWCAGHVGGRLYEEHNAERNSPILTDRNMPR